MPRSRQPNRRRFLQTVSAAGAAAVLPASSDRIFAADSPNERPVFASIGLRNQGWVITQSALEATDVVALADVDANILGATAEKMVNEKNTKRPDTYKDYRSILERDDIDAVLIATPDHWHAKIAIEAMYAGKDVYCEKPLTLTIAEGKLIEKVVKETGRVFQVGTMKRSQDNFLKAMAMIRGGRIGDLKRVTCGLKDFQPSPSIPVADVPKGLDWDFWLGPAPKVDYRALPEVREGYGGGVPFHSNCHYSFRNWFAYSGGKMTDWGAHFVDIGFWGIGEKQTAPIEVTPQDFKMGCEYKDGYPVPQDRYNVATTFEVKVDLADGVEMIITSEGDGGVLFEGTKGRFFVNRGKLAGKPAEDLASNPLPDGAIEEVYGGPHTPNHVVNLINSMRSREQPISDVWSHNQMLEICHLSNIAMRLNRSLKWDPSKREIIGDDQASSFMSRENRKGFEIEM
ncbi:Alpha-N-acetylgalactosaminidase [Rubripirellula amarantea]|uniref:Alpha-N-acetylgalactosaminidase n=1 Tax=Rubripirellula amarantea TaxID=2527999 RepID=A0A5C5WE45_9BACT|nr:Gfo/Idh/MocA family oxidoreductase [Rubripirellula amarantea]TWT48002.1 Alpha-N-acetylgalactosaminidase [Rubripirellula amarantea]